MLVPAAVIHGRYRILDKVGQGTFGAVYRVQSLFDNRILALKELSDAAMNEPGQRFQAASDFSRDAKMLRDLDHPNIPRFLEDFKQDGKIYLVMEYVDGDTLEAMLERQGGPFDESVVRNWTYQLCDALSYIHARGIVFRDLKPANVMVDRAGRVKLIDFGIARVFDARKATDTQHLGTRGYAAQEQFGGQSDRRSDICALGAMLHQLLTCQHPITCGSPHLLPPVKSLNPRVSDVMARVIARAVEYQPDNRWQNVTEITQTLGGGKPIGAGPATPVAQTQTATAQSSAPVLPAAPVKSSASPTQLLAQQTSRLISKVAQLSYPQLIVGVGALVVAVLVLMPLFSGFIGEQFPWLWANVPGYAIIAPAAWFAARRRGAALLAYVPLCLVGWMRANYSIDLGAAAVAVVASGLVAELVLTATDTLARGAKQPAWTLEVAGAAATGVAATLVFDLLAFAQIPNAFSFLFAGALGAAGWFLGDWFYRTWTLTRAGQGSASHSQDG